MMVTVTTNAVSNNRQHRLGIYDKPASAFYVLYFVYSYEARALMAHGVVERGKGELRKVPNATEPGSGGFRRSPASLVSNLAF